MKLHDSTPVQTCIQNFISNNPEMKHLVGRLSDRELLHETTLVHESLESGQPALPPARLVSLVQEVRGQKPWVGVLEQLKASLEEDWSAAELEVCAIGLLWCSLLAQECGRCSEAADFTANGDREPSEKHGYS